MFEVIEPIECAVSRMGADCGHGEDGGPGCWETTYLVGCAGCQVPATEHRYKRDAMAWFLWHYSRRHGVRLATR
jgi:hypothetical protein